MVHVSIIHNRLYGFGGLAEIPVEHTARDTGSRVLVACIFALRMWGEDRSECSASGAASGARVVMGRFCDRLFNRLNSLEVSMGVLRDDRSQPGFDLTKARAFGKSKGPRPIGAPFTERISGDFG